MEEVVSIEGMKKMAFWVRFGRVVFGLRVELKEFLVLGFGNSICLLGGDAAFLEERMVWEE